MSTPIPISELEAVAEHYFPTYPKESSAVSPSPSSSVWKVGVFPSSVPTLEERILFNQRVKDCITGIFSTTITNDERTTLVNRLESIFYRLHIYNLLLSSASTGTATTPPSSSTMMNKEIAQPLSNGNPNTPWYNQIVWATEWVQYIPYIFQTVLSTVPSVPLTVSSVSSSASNPALPLEATVGIVGRLLLAITGYGTLPSLGKGSEPVSSSSSSSFPSSSSSKPSLVSSLMLLVPTTTDDDDSSIPSSPNYSPPVVHDTNLFQTLIQTLITLPEQYVNMIHKIHHSYPRALSDASTVSSLTVVLNTAIPPPLQSATYGSRLRYDVHNILINHSSAIETFLSVYTTKVDISTLGTEETSKDSNATTNRALLLWLRKYQFIVEKIIKTGQLTLFYQDWVQTAYFYSGMGGIQLHTQYLIDKVENEIHHPSSSTVVTVPERPEFPNAHAQYQRAYQISYLSTYLLYLLDLNCSQGYGNLSSTINNIILTCHGITLDYISCTPEAGKRASPTRTESGWSEYSLGLLLIILGKKDALPSTIYKYLQSTIFTSTVLPSITLRNVISYLLFPYVLPARLAYRLCKNTTGVEKWFTALREPVDASLMEGRGYLSTIESSALVAMDTSSSSSATTSGLKITLTEWLNNFPFVSLVEVWSQPSTILQMNNNIQRNLTLCILFALPMLPSEAFQPSCPLLSLLMMGIQHRLDLPYNNEQFTYAMAIAETFSKRYTPNTPFTFSLDELTNKAKAKAGNTSTDTDGTEGRNEPSCSELVRQQDEQTFVRALDRLRKGYAKDSFNAIFSNEGDTKNNENTETKANTDDNTAVTLSPSPPLSSSVSITATVSPPLPPEDPSVTAARRHFAMKAPVYLYQAYIRLMTYMKEESGSTDNNALPIPGGSALDEDSQLVSSGGPDASVALFSTLERLIREASEDTTGTGQNQLLELCVPLLKCLLTVQNRYNEPDFPIWRFNALVAIVVGATPMATQYLYSQFHFTNNPTVSEGTRLEILDILVAAARELQGDEIATVPTPLPPWENPDWRPVILNDFGHDDPDKDDGSSQSSRQKMDSRSNGGKVGTTPTPGTEKKANTSPVLPNFFSALGMDYFFNPLFRILLESNRGSSTSGSSSSSSGFDNDDDNFGSDGKTGMDMKELFTTSTFLTGGTTLSGKDQPSLLRATDPSLPSTVEENLAHDLHSSHDRLLAQSLRALAVFVEFTNRDRSVVRMVRSLLPLAWYLRNRTDANLRAACLSGIAACIAGIHKHESTLLLSPSVLTGLGMDYDPTEDGTSTTEKKEENIIRIGTNKLSASSSSSTVLNELSRIGEKLQKTSDLQRIGKEIRDTSIPSLSSVEHRKMGIPVTNTGSMEDTISTTNNALFSNEPTVWDDLVVLVSWLRLRSTTDPDSTCRQLAGQMVQNSLLKELLLGPLTLEDIQQLQEDA